jgi:hypothetical protein
MTKTNKETRELLRTVTEEEKKQIKEVLERARIKKELEK